MHAEWQFWGMWACGIATGFGAGWFASWRFYRRETGSN
jgi:hypothetical protein